MKKQLYVWLAFVLGMLGVVSIYRAQSSDPVEYVKVCSLYGAGFHYIPGTDICLNDFTGDARVQTPSGTWRSRLPYPEGKWVTNMDGACSQGRLVTVGNFRSTDFTLNPYNRKVVGSFSLTPQC